MPCPPIMRDTRPPSVSPSSGKHVTRDQGLLWFGGLVNCCTLFGMTNKNYSSSSSFFFSSSSSSSSFLSSHHNSSSSSFSSSLSPASRKTNKNNNHVNYVIIHLIYMTNGDIVPKDAARPRIPQGREGKWGQEVKQTRGHAWWNS
ncbi:hypothetical protein E2C01_023509 [Portunus trituberculatus]|uniref:Uncharacterized protein n=1 Tax=Portunus trituberculatus TaxID=210409 RepID=A0A5B7EA17_PORTR|nr:hypothetical protein [Portunus trituberculatus]